VDHATGYAALAMGLIDWDNYEAETDYFPVRFRPWAVRPASLDVEGDPAHLQVPLLQARVDYIYCWRMPSDAPVAAELDRRCTLVAAGEQWRLYSAKPPPPKLAASLPGRAAMLTPNIRQ
jgi:hypothetical protein